MLWLPLLIRVASVLAAGVAAGVVVHVGQSAADELEDAASTVRRSNAFASEALDAVAQLRADKLSAEQANARKASQLEEPAG